MVKKPIMSGLYGSRPAITDAPLPTVVVGGLGGSGTRVVAALLQAGGLHIGHDLNQSLDNLWATLLFKRRDLTATGADEIDARFALFAQATLGSAEATWGQRMELERLARDDRPQHEASWLQARATHLANACSQPQSIGAGGWKEPNSHMLLPHLARRGVRYIHVVRDGLYMSASRNRNQHAYWADALGCPDPQPTPAYALAFWCAALRRARCFADAMGPRFLMLDYDRLCMDPAVGIGRLNAFLKGTGIHVDATAAAMVSPGKPSAPALDDGLAPVDVGYAMAWSGARS